MKARWKISFSLILILIIVGIFGINPASAEGSVYFGITEYRTLSEPNFGYCIGDPVTGSATAAKLWNMSQYSSGTSNNPIDVNAYCIKAGVGFEDSGEKLEYNQSFDMYKDRNILESNDYDVVTNLVTRRSL